MTLQIRYFLYTLKKHNLKTDATLLVVRLLIYIGQVIMERKVHHKNTDYKYLKGLIDDVKESEFDDVYNSNDQDIHSTCKKYE